MEYVLKLKMKILGQKGKFEQWLIYTNSTSFEKKLLKHKVYYPSILNIIV